MKTIKNPAARGGRESAGPEQRRGTFDNTRIGADVHTLSAKNPPPYVRGGDRCRNLADPYNRGIQLNTATRIMPDYLTVCEKAAREGAKILLNRQGTVEAIEKGPKDIVTEADFASQNAIVQILLDAYPNHLVMAEECDGNSSAVNRSAGAIPSDQYRWIIDPLDGTINYVHGIPSFAVSVALERGGELLVGVVYDPILDECFSAVVGEGAFLNGKPVCSSTCDSMREALMAVSFSANVPRDSVEIRRFVEVLHASHTIRRLGSAALNLCYVACGRLDGYIASSVKAWDVAAGALLLREAGATITSLDGGSLDLYRPRFACAATVKLHAELMEILAQVE